MKKRYKNSDYIIYDDGRCYSELSQKFLTPQMSSKYPSYNLTLNGKKKKTKVHRMVAETFLPKIEGKEIVNHKDGDTHNYKLENLEWVTPKENAKHAVVTGLLPTTDQNGVFLDKDLEIEGEEWLPVKEFPNYLVSSFGRIMNKNTNRILKGCISNNGYHQINLWKNNKGTSVLTHKLVYSYFNQDFDLKGYVINHKDGDKTNNQLNNLEKITYQENNLHAEYVIKTHNCSKAVYQLDENFNIINEFVSMAEATRQTGINNISRAVRQKSKAGGFYWKKKEE